MTSPRSSSRHAAAPSCGGRDEREQGRGGRGAAPAPARVAPPHPSPRSAHRRAGESRAAAPAVGPHPRAGERVPRPFFAGGHDDVPATARRRRGPLLGASGGVDRGLSHGAAGEGLPATLPATAVISQWTRWSRWTVTTRRVDRERLRTTQWTASMETFNPRVLGSNPGRLTTSLDLSAHRCARSSCPCSPHHELTATPTTRMSRMSW